MNPANWHRWLPGEVFASYAGGGLEGLRRLRKRYDVLSIDARKVSDVGGRWEYRINGWRVDDAQMTLDAVLESPPSSVAIASAEYFGGSAHVVNVGVPW